MDKKLASGATLLDTSPALARPAGTMVCVTSSPAHSMDAASLRDQGTRRWKLDGHLHREDGPAVVFASGTRIWFRHGRRHREDGPAIEWFDGDKKWFLNDRDYTKPEWLREVLSDRPLTAAQRDLLRALSENWEGTPALLYETVTHLAG